jgi:hypothetical protein
MRCIYREAPVTVNREITADVAIRALSSESLPRTWSGVETGSREETRKTKDQSGMRLD